MAWTFAIARLTLTGMVCLVLGPWGLYKVYLQFPYGFTAEGAGGLAVFITYSVWGVASLVGLGIAVTSAWVVRALFRHRDAIDGVDGVPAWSSSIVGALASLALLGWIGLQCFQRGLPALDASACANLGDAGRSSAE
ncbi:MAG: hypothetical protein WCJ69_11315 [Betaproteobacteria bacterium]